MNQSATCTSAYFVLGSVLGTKDFAHQGEEIQVSNLISLILKGIDDKFVNK